jgi:hypothetical protein
VSPARNVRTGPLRTAAGLVVAGLLAACTSGPAPAATREPDVAVEDGPAATDAPRPPATDVVLARAAVDEETGDVQAAGYVSPVVESGGTCTLELRRDGRTATASGPAEPDASTTVCGDLAVPVAELEPGEWQAVLVYRSPSTSGESDPLAVRVPA